MSLHPTLVVIFYKEAVKFKATGQLFTPVSIIQDNNIMDFQAHSAMLVDKA